MRVVSDYAAVRAEMEKRGFWKKFAESSLPIRTVIGDLEVFYEQRGYAKPESNFIVWFRFEKHEQDRYQNLVQELARRCPDGGVELMQFLARKTGQRRVTDGQ